MPSAKDLAAPCRRFISAGLKADEKNEQDKARIFYIRAAEQCLANAWLNATADQKKDIETVMYGAGHLLTDTEKELCK